MKNLSFLSPILLLLLVSACKKEITSSNNDTVKPTLSIEATITGDNIVDASEATSLSISGSTDAEDGQVVEITFLDFDTTIMTSATVAGGTWATNPTDISSLFDGPVVVIARVSDISENMTVMSTEFELDQNNLDVSIAEPVGLDNKIIYAESLMLRVNGTAGLDDGESVTITFSDGTNDVSSTTELIDGVWRSSKTNLSGLSDGNIIIRAAITDTDGNKAQHVIGEIELDKSTRPLAPSSDGTVWISNKISTESDPTVFESITDKGQGMRTMFDQRTRSWNEENAWLFEVVYSDGITVEAQVNPEFTQEQALSEATFYSTEIGRLPLVLRRDAETFWIHKGNEAFGGGNNNFLIHTGLGDEELKPRGFVNEIFLHEGTHTSLDAYIKDDPEWKYAQQADGGFISEYARDNPGREDIAESLIMYLAYKYRPDTITAQTKTLIETNMSYRMAFFDTIDLDLSPLID